MASVIRNLREKKALSQSALAELMGVSQDLVSKWELGERRLHLGQIKELSSIFGVDPGYLLRSEGATLTDLMSEKQVSEKMLSDKLRVSTATVRRYQKFGVTYLQAVKIAKALGVSTLTVLLTNKDFYENKNESNSSSSAVS